MEADDAHAQADSAQRKSKELEQALTTKESELRSITLKAEKLEDELEKIEGRVKNAEERHVNST